MELLSVAEFNKLVNIYLSDLGELAVRGEVVSLKFSQNGAAFLELKDKDEPALLKVSNYAPKVEGIRSISEGMEVVIYGYPEIYSPYGSFSFKPRKIEPVGDGSLKIAFENLQRELSSMGYFATERKRSLPEVVERIALITANGSAALADFCKILTENASGIEIDLYPVLVQGEKSSEQIVAACELAAQSDVQVLVLIRGGGSLEDLQSFNSEAVAKCIFNSRIPVLVGVGHEVDTTIADMVADVRAATPSQAAYYLCQQNEAFIQNIYSILDSAANTLLSTMPTAEEVQQRLSVLEQKLLNILPGRSQISSWEQTLRMYIDSNFFQLQATSQHANLIQSRIQEDLASWITKVTNKLDSQVELIEAYNPYSILARGYSVTKVNGKVVKSVDQVSIHDKITTVLTDGQLISKLLSE